MSDEWDDRSVDAGGARAVEIDEALDLLRSPRRRWMLEYLDRTDGSETELDEVAEYVRKRERRRERESDPALETVYNDLYHAHVPRLRTAGVASYDASADVLECDVLPEPISSFLDLAREFEPGGREE